VSIIRRTSVSFITNITKVLLSFLTGILLARGLGPSDYGVFAFLLATFAALRAFLDMGSSRVFFTFISKKNRTRIFFGYYIVWLLIQFVFSFILIAFVAPDEWVQRIWEGENRERVLLAFIAVFMRQQIWNMIAHVGESQRLTVRVQLINILVAITQLCVVTGMYWLDALTIERIFYFIIAEFILASFLAFYIFPLQYALGREALGEVFREYLKFCLPQVPYALLFMLTGFVDTWLLQHYGGSSEQAYYAVGKQFSIISFVATTSILRILWKEVAEANENGDNAKVQFLYERTHRILCIFGASVSCFLIPWTSEIIQFLLGDEYIGASVALALMLISTIHQSLGQVNSVMYFSIELIRHYVIIGMILMVVGLITSYLFLAPSNAVVPGLGLASTGLAMKMVILQFIGVNSYSWWLSRHQGWKYSFGYQFTSIFLLMVTGFFTYYLVNYLFEHSLHFIFRISITGMLYFFAASMILYLKPSLLGMKHEEMMTYINSFVLKLKSLKKSSNHKVIPPINNGGQK
jgi:O-antigen/teichoic acid export membrane protein